MIDSAAVTLADTGLSETYQELEAAIGTAADAVAKVSDQNVENAREVFNPITGAPQARQRRSALVRLYRAAGPIAEWAAVLELLRRALNG